MVTAVAWKPMKNELDMLQHVLLHFENMVYSIKLENHRLPSMRDFGFKRYCTVQGKKELWRASLR